MTRGGARIAPRKAAALAPAALAAAGMAAAAFLPFYELRPNRIAQGRAVFLAQAEPLALAALAAVWALFALLSIRRAGSALASLAAATIPILALLATGLAAPRLAGASLVLRLGLGSGFWLLCLAAYAAYLLSRRPDAANVPWVGPACAAAIALVLGILLATGSLGALSMLREWSGRRGAFAAELARHAALTAEAAISGGIIGAAIGAGASRGRAQTGGFLFLNIVQTIPSLALFGLLIIPLAALAERFPLLRSWGISGIGAAPALIALSLYAALPVARNTYAGFQGVPASALDAGRGMGMGRAQLFLRVELPLALPVAVAGFRTAAVQAVGNTAVAALIGAGGLGVFIFQGLGQFAMDMVLLGTLPVIAMALAVDAALGALARALTPRGLRLEALKAAP